jgi:ABC-type branched-subunit amino acid transport system permease subunit
MTVAIAFAAMAAHIAAMHRGGAADRGEDGGEDGPHRRAVVFTLLIVAGLVVNAAVCGAISNPVHRYQARVVWLAVVAAVMLEAARPIVLSRIFRRKMGKGVVGQRRFERGQESQREPSRLTGAPPG